MITINFGLSGLVPIVLYVAFLIAMGMTVFWRPIVGIYFLAPLIPSQTIRDRMAAYPLGGSVVTVMLLAIAIGLLRTGQPLFPKSRLRVVLLVYMALTFVSLCAGTIFLHREFPMPWDDSRFLDWRNYFTMLLLLFLTAAAVQTTKQMKILMAIVFFGVLVFNRSFYNEVSDKDFSEYNEDSRYEGGSGFAGVNGFAAFEAQVATFLIGLSGYLEKRSHRWAAVALAGFSALCLMYSLSRGGYLALAVGLLFLGIVRYRKLLLVMVLFGMTWTALVPGAVYQRVTMTTDNPGGNLDHSSETRVSLWEEAFEEVSASPVFGLGFNTYAYMDHLRGYRDSHNIYVKFLVETGYVGVVIFLIMMAKTWTSGFQLFRQAQEPFHAGMGLGLAGWVVAALVGNMFGDRFTYLQVAGYMFLFGGMVVRGYMLEQELAERQEAGEVGEDGEELESETESVTPGSLEWGRA